MKKALSLLLCILMLTCTACSPLTSLLGPSEKQVYTEAMQKAIRIMADGQLELATCTDLVQNVWRDAIYEEKHDDTQKYTMKNGRFVEDFNIALDTLYSDPSFKEKRNHIDENQQELRRLRVTMETVPKGAQAFHGPLQEAVSSYIDISCTLIDLDGSYNEISKRFTDLYKVYDNAWRDFNAYEDALSAFLS